MMVSTVTRINYYNKRYLGFLLLGILLFFLLPQNFLIAQTDEDFEEISVWIRVQGIGGFDMTGIYSYRNQKLYLPITDFFTALRINQETLMNYDTIRGFFIDEQNKYIIAYPTRTIRYQTNLYQLQPEDLLRTEAGLFLLTDYFGKVFGLHCTFNFRALTIEIKSDLELPAIKEMRLQQIRQNVQRLKGVITVDTSLGRQYHLFRLGVVDWAFNSFNVTGERTDTRIITGLGSELLFGETNLVINYSTREKFALQNQLYQWRWANNQFPIIRQVRAGKISPNSISSIFNPFNGVSITNAPTSFRRSFGTYNISDYTEPGWTVELYINNVLVDYTVADASGFYTFEVPLIYGTSEIMLKFYGPYGEERSRERTMSISYMFLPQGEAEYSLIGGFVDDSENSLFSRGEINYGISRHLTVGGGIEYLSSIPARKNIPFLKASINPHPYLIFSGEYDHEVVSRGKVSFRNKKKWFFEADLAKYRENQKAIMFNYLEERRITTSIPFRLFLMKGFARLSYKQNVYSEFSYNSAEFTLSGVYGPFNANVSTYGNWITHKTPNISTNIAAGIRLGRNFHLRGQSMWDVNNKEPINLKLELDRRIFTNGYINFLLERNFRMGFLAGEVSFRYDLNFAQTNLSGRYVNRKFSSNIGARGSITFGGGDGYIYTSNRSHLGRGAVIFEPFLDVNHNLIRDEGESRVEGLSIRLNSGKFLSKISDTLIRVVELEPYTSYLAEVEPRSIENISWQVPFKRINVHVDPNQFKWIPVPVQPMGEINGMVYLSRAGSLKGTGRILINIYTEEGLLVQRVLTESTGSYTYLGLKPGRYYVLPDPIQQQRLQIISRPERIDFEIQMNELGDIIDGLDFILVPADEVLFTLPAVIPEQADQLEEILQESEKAVPLPSAEPSDVATLPAVMPITEQPNQLPGHPVDSADIVIVVSGNISPWDGEFFVQAGAFPSEKGALKRWNEIRTFSSCPSGIIFENGLFKVRAGYFASRKEAQRCYDDLFTRGFDVFIGRQPVYPAAVIYQTTPVSGLTEGKYFVQAGAFPSDKQARLRLQRVKETVDYPAEIVQENGLFKIRIGYFSKWSQAEQCRQELLKNGIEAFVGIRK